jgi:hypothetical protein
MCKEEYGKPAHRGKSLHRGSEGLPEVAAAGFAASSWIARWPPQAAIVPSAPELKRSGAVSLSLKGGCVPIELGNGLTPEEEAAELEEVRVLLDATNSILVALDRAGLLAEPQDDESIKNGRTNAE